MSDGQHTVALCEHCWALDKTGPMFRAALGARQRERCHRCKRPTHSGIYVRRAITVSSLRKGPGA